MQNPSIFHMQICTYQIKSSNFATQPVERAFEKYLFITSSLLALNKIRANSFLKIFFANYLRMSNFLCNFAPYSVIALRESLIFFVAHVGEMSYKVRWGTDIMK